jgi:hypothetical protein
MINGTELSAQEFRDQLLIRYAKQPSDMPKTCNGCGSIHTVGHALQCKVGGLVILRHDEIANILADLSMKALTPSAERDEPRIHPHSRKLEKPEPTNQENPVQYCKAKSNDEDRGDILVRGLWQRGTDCIIDVRVTDINSKSQCHLTPAKALLKHEREKKSKHLDTCIEQQRHFTPFVLSTDGHLGMEAKVLLKRLSALLAAKWDKPYSVVCGFVNTRMSITITRATNLCLGRSRIPAGHISTKHPMWEDSAGLGLYRTN